MDFLDPKKQRRHAIMLYTGYVFIGIAVLISTMVLLYQASGFGINSKGQVVQNGLVFMSTQPNPADIYLNGVKNKAQTNTRLSIPAGEYEVRLARQGYHDWTRNINVLGGDVQNYDYPFLFPKQLEPKAEVDYEVSPGLATQSRDRRWLMVQQNPTSSSFDVYDLQIELQMVAETITIPSGLLTPANGNQSWEVIQWANNNRHVLIKRTYGSGYEYLLIDRVNVGESLNLNNTLNTSPVQLTLIDNKFDQFHILSATNELSRATIQEPAPVSVLKDVISYKSYGTKRIIYATTQDADAGKVNIRILDGEEIYGIREFAAGGTYSLEIADYRGSQYVVLASSIENIVYIYLDPVDQLSDPKVKIPAAIRALRVPNAGYVSFSPTARYIMAQSGNRYGVYDIFLKRAYVYTINDPIDAPQTHSTWMDGDRLTYISNGKQLVFDFDGRNFQPLAAANVAQGAFFSQDYRYVFGFAPNANVTQLNRTGLRTAADL